MTEKYKAHLILPFIILLCIICIIYVSAISTGSSIVDWVLGIFSIIIFVYSSLKYQYEQNISEMKKMTDDWKKNDNNKPWTINDSIIIEKSIENRDFDKDWTEYKQRQHEIITNPDEFLKIYNEGEPKNMKDDLWHYFHNSDETVISDDIIQSIDTTNKLKKIYDGLIDKENAKKRFIYDVENLLPKNIDKTKYIEIFN